MENNLNDNKNNNFLIKNEHTRIKLEKELHTELIIKEEMCEETDTMEHDGIHLNNNQQTEEKLLSTGIVIKDEMSNENFLEYENARFSCDICDKTFTNKRNFLHHKRILHENGEKLYSCSDCDKKFSWRSTYYAHKRMHTDEKPFSCDVCKKILSNQSRLIAHKRTHTGEKPYSCDICEKKFTDKSSVIKHKQIHTGIKQFSCDECKKAFFRHTHLIAHKRTHTGEKPFSCDICKKKFTEKKTISQHKKRFHSSELNTKRIVCKVEQSDSMMMGDEHIKLEKQLNTELIIKDEVVDENSLDYDEPVYE